ncbi:MAG: alpha/beta fold hydrolase [Acidobacteriota bacterium]
MREIGGPAGRLEALLDEPGPSTTVRAAVVFAHPHPQQGGTMHTKVVYQAAKALARIGCAVLRFNFRGVGTSDGQFDHGVGEADDFRAGVEFMRHRHPAAPLWTAGFSFGAWIALTAGAADPRVSTLIGIAPPLTRYDFETVRISTTAKFFVQGEFDEICRLKAMQQFYARCEEPKELVVIDAADHLFDGKTIQVAEAIEDLLADWPG